MDLKEEVKTIRHDLGLSQRELGEKLGRNRDHIKDIERGTKRLSAEDYLKLKEFHRQNIKGTSVPGKEKS